MARTTGRVIGASWAQRGSVRLVVMGIMVLIALLTGCASSGGQIDTAASGAPTTSAPVAADTASPTPSGTTAASAADLPSGAHVGLAPSARAFEHAAAVTALRRFVDARTRALINMNPLYGPYAASASGELLADDRAYIQKLRNAHYQLHGRAYYSIVRVSRPSPTEAVVDSCEKDSSVWFVDPRGKPLQAKVTNNWLPDRYTVDFVAGRWVPTAVAKPTTPDFCAGAA